jgi:KUP system potassium uptake protein
VFLNSNRDATPLALRANLEHNRVVHQAVVIVLVTTLKVPHVKPTERVVVDDLGYRDDGITHLTVHFGYQDRHDLTRSLAGAAGRGLEHPIDVDRASYFLSRVTIVPTGRARMSRWRKKLFVAMARNEADSTRYFRLPEERAVTMGSLIEL